MYVGGGLNPKYINKLLRISNPLEQPVLACINGVNGVKVALRNKKLLGKSARCDIFGKR